MRCNRLQLLIAPLAACVLLLLFQFAFCRDAGKNPLAEEIEKQQQFNDFLASCARAIERNIVAPDMPAAPVSPPARVSFTWHADGRLSDAEVSRIAPFTTRIPAEKFQAIEDALLAAVRKSSPLARGAVFAAGTYECSVSYSPGSRPAVQMHVSEVPREQEALDTVSIPGEALMPAPEDTVFGFIDNAGKALVKPRFLQARPFRNGLAVVRGDSGWGAIDRNGKSVIGERYQYMADLNEGRIGVRERGLCGFVDATGRTVVAPAYSQCGDFADGLAPVKVGPAWGYIDGQGRMAIEPQFDAADEFSQSRAAVRNMPGVASGSGPEGYIDRTGRFAIRPDYAIALGFREGLATVASHDFKFFAIDAGGRPVVKSGMLPPWERFNEGLARFVAGAKVGYMDTSGRGVIAPQFDYDESSFAYTGWFSEGLAAVKTGKSYGYIDKTGKLAIPARYAFAGPFREGLAPVLSGGKFGYIDKSGKMVVQPSFAVAYPFSDGRALVGVRRAGRP